MKKIIHCIIISLILFSHTTFCAQVPTSSFLKTTEVVFSNESYEEPMNGTLWKVSDTYIQDLNYDFYIDGISNRIAFHNKNVNYLPTTTAVNSTKISDSSTGVVASDDSESAASLKPCTTFLITTSSFLLLIIASIIVIRIKTNTLKLF